MGYRARIGLLTPNDDAVPESEFWTMAPKGVSVHVARELLVDTRIDCPPLPAAMTDWTFHRAAVASAVPLPLDPNPLYAGDAQRLEQRCTGKFVESTSVALWIVADRSVSAPVF